MGTASFQNADAKETHPAPSANPRLHDRLPLCETTMQFPH
jgi:hypothetical protein